jgi:hypothetical protein
LRVHDPRRRPDVGRYLVEYPPRGEVRRTPSRGR